MKVVIENDGGIEYQFTYNDGSYSHLSVTHDGMVIYSSDGRKTKFTLDECRVYIDRDAKGDSVVFTSNDTDTVTLAIMVGERRLWENRDRAETRRHESYSDDNDKRDRLTDKHVNIEDEVLCRETVRTVMLSLKPEEQYIVRRLYLDDEIVSQVELAQELRMGYEAFKKRVQRIMQKLGKII